MEQGEEVLVVSKVSDGQVEDVLRQLERSSSLARSVCIRNASFSPKNQEAIGEALQKMALLEQLELVGESTSGMLHGVIRILHRPECKLGVLRLEGCRPTDENWLSLFAESLKQNCSLHSLALVRFQVMSDQVGALAKTVGRHPCLQRFFFYGNTNISVGHGVLAIEGLQQSDSLRTLDVMSLSLDPEAVASLFLCRNLETLRVTLGRDTAGHEVGACEALSANCTLCTLELDGGAWPVRSFFAALKGHQSLVDVKVSCPLLEGPDLGEIAECLSVNKVLKSLYCTTPSCSFTDIGIANFCNRLESSNGRLQKFFIPRGLTLQKKMHDTVIGRNRRSVANAQALVLQLLAGRKSRPSILSHLPKEILLIIAKLVWSTRYEPNLWAKV